jgi:peptide/nickel transport system permease protein
MQRYLLRRTAQIIPTIFLIIVIEFLLIHMAPGDPARVMAGERAHPDNVEAIRVRFGLDKPLHEQFFVYLGRLAQGDLGYSYNYLTPVLDLIIGRLPQTLFLVFTATALAIVIGTFLGTMAASRYPSKTDSGIVFTSVIFYSLPVFWLGTLFILLFARKLQWFPLGGTVDIIEKKTGLAYYLDFGWHAFLPVLTLAIFTLPQFIRIARTSVIETLQEGYITTAHAVGMSRRRVLYGHALRNAILPTVTLAGIIFGYTLFGAALVESVFSWPGIGMLLWQAIYNRDYPTLLGVFLFASICVVLIGLLTDVLYAVLDPRVRLG